MAGAIVLGTIGYVLIEDQTPLGGLYLTMITISTVGFAEPDGGFGTGGQIFTIFLLLVGVGAVFYTAVGGLEFMVEEVIGGAGRLRRDLRKADRMKDHFIVCGFGQVGREAWEQLPADRTLVIELDQANVDLARARGAVVVVGDATHDETLIDAGIERAEALIACVRSDSDNVAIVLSARALCAGLRIIARATEAESERKLELAGADRIVAPQVVGAERLAALALRPDLTEFVDIAAGEALVEFRIEEIHVPVGSPIVSTSIQESGLRNRSGVLILAVKQAHGPVLVSPSAAFELGAGQTLVCIGTDSQLKDAIAYIQG
jgi:voltage-gated potassium channel